MAAHICEALSCTNVRKDISRCGICIFKIHRVRWEESRKSEAGEDIPDRVGERRTEFTATKSLIDLVFQSRSKVEESNE